jgi:hypothetical protein
VTIGVDENSSGSCPVADFGSNGVEPLGFVTAVFMYLKKYCL